MAFNPIVIEKGLNAGFARDMARFQADREAAPGIMAAAMQMPSGSAYEKLGWLAAMPTVQQWLGELNAKDLEDFDWTIKNLDWAVSVLLNENDLDDDQTGSLSLYPTMLAQRIMGHPSRLILDLLINGDSNLAYDGSAFFANRSVNDNLLSGNGVTLANLDTDLNSALVAMSKFVDSEGEPLGIRGNLIVCPVALENTFRKLVESNASPTASGGVDTFNPYSGRFTVVSDPRLDADDANDWYLLATNEIIKPIVFLLRQAAQNRMEKKNLTKTWVWSADYRGNGGYGLPHLAVKTVNP